MSYRAQNMGSKEVKPDAEADRSRRVRQKRIGDQLRRLYDDVTSEPVPDEFLNLLEQADKSSEKK
ncbi:NepR family anti-sigma factor [Henriciella mobilis]|uniref:NepR family anti-sigma factor n=2 Tax=Henriciella mobilis TaxID=2305467 RepID=UPI0011C35AC9|nr:NepR family anti-sigma factor [Henriciella mobilis]